MLSNNDDFNGMCPKAAPSRKFSVTAVAARDVLPNGTLVYNNRTNQGGILHDPTAILYVRSTISTRNRQAQSWRPRRAARVEGQCRRLCRADVVE